MGFSRQEYWSGLPFPSPGDLPNPGIEPGSPTFQADVLISEPPRKGCVGIQPLKFVSYYIVHLLYFIVYYTFSILLYFKIDNLNLSEGKRKNNKHIGIK